MIKRLVGGAVAVILLGSPATPAEFDYYLLALSWSPSWCEAEGRARGADQCAPEEDHGFTLHGLWPQFESGWPEDCPTAQADPSRRQTAAMADIMGSAGLAWHEWQRHGRCSGLDAAAYFDASRRVFEALRLPDLAGVEQARAAEIEAALLALNPALDASRLIVTCRDGRLAEVRICLTRDYEPRTCAADVARDACREGTMLEVPQP